MGEAPHLSAWWGQHVVTRQNGLFLAAWLQTGSSRKLSNLLLISSLSAHICQSWSVTHTLSPCQNIFSSKSSWRMLVFAIKWVQQWVCNLLTQTRHEAWVSFKSQNFPTHLFLKMLLMGAELSSFWIFGVSCHKDICHLLVEATVFWEDTSNRN